MRQIYIFIIYTLTLILGVSFAESIYSQSVTATYTAGAGKTDSYFYDLSGYSSCPLPLTVTIPDGAEITGVDIEYKMTAVSYGMKSDQVSQLRCVSPGGTREAELSLGSGFTTGTCNYNRTGLKIANNVSGGGTIHFELHAGRTFGGDGCGTTYNYVENNWKITVHYVVYPNCNTTPFAGIAQSSLELGCSGINTKIRLSAIGYSDDLNGLKYQWQYSTDGINNWTNISGATDPDYAEYNTSSSKFFRLKVTCEITGEADYSNVLSYLATNCQEYEIGSQSGIVYTCNSLFYDSGGSGSYSNNENSTIRFCSESGEHLKIEFLSFETEDNGEFGRYQERYDKLRVWDGSVVNNYPLYELSGLQNSTNKVPIIISSGECISFSFISDESFVKPGWLAHVSCTEEQANIASQYCVTAPNICNLNGYQGATSNFYNVERVYDQIQDEGTFFPGFSALDNNSFITFIAAEEQVVLEIEVTDCNGGFYSPGGVQFAVYSGSNCHFTSLVSSMTYIDPGLHEGYHDVVILNLTPGEIYYMMTDGNFGSVCNYSIKAQSGIEMAMVYPNQALLCEGESATISASGGSSYHWSGPSGFSSNNASINVTEQGVYTVTITGGIAECPSEVVLNSVVEVIPFSDTPVFNLPELFCYGETISPLPTTSLNNVHGIWTPAINNTQTTTYTFISNGGICSYPYYHTITISPDLLITSQQPKCFGENGLLFLNSTSNQTPLIFSVNGINTGSTASVPAGSHQVVVTDNNGCSRTRDYSLSQPNELVLDYELIDRSCYGNTDADVKLSAQGGTNPYYFSILNGEIHTQGEEHFNLTQSEYTLIVRDNNSCTTEKILNIYQPAQLSAYYTYSNPSCVGNIDGTVDFTVIGGTEPYTFLWNNDSAQTNLITGFSEGVYTITITDSHQCSNEIRGITFIDLPVECIWIPNAFTPNGDGINDLWIIENLEIYSGAVLNIYNRWGQLIHTGGCADKWDGKCNDRFVASGTYLYILDLKNGDNPFVGNLSVIY